MRTHAFSYQWIPVKHRDHGKATRRTTESELERVWENNILWFLLHLEEPGRVDFGYTMDGETGAPKAVFFTSPDGSWCEVSLVGEGPRDVWEGGPRHLWEQIESAEELWASVGKPGWQRFGMTVTPTENVVWLDEPGGSVSWSLDVSSA
jgi:hypothetical protein